MESLDYWRLCDELSVLQAAALIAGVDPSGEEGAWCDTWPLHQQPKGFAAAKAALVHAINARRLSATIRHSARQFGCAEMVAEDFTVEEGENVGYDATFVYRAAPDWNLTTVLVDDLRRWLASRGIHTGFFLPDGNRRPRLLGPGKPPLRPEVGGGRAGMDGCRRSQGQVAEASVAEVAARARRGL